MVSVQDVASEVFPASGSPNFMRKNIRFQADVKISVINETGPRESRTVLVPENAAKLVALGAGLTVESDLGKACGILDAAYEKAGAKLSRDRSALLAEADLLLRIHAPAPDEIGRLKNGAIHISLLDPFQNRETLNGLASQGVTALSLEMIPRITRAQSMDVLSSQANLAGYAAVILAAGHLNKIFPLLMTAAGTFRPAKVLVIGAGVAGLQACATAHRLGAQVQAFDTRPVVEQEVRSVGARFLKIDLGQAGQDEQGYARSLTAEQLQKQREALRQVCADSDVVITAAQVFGRRAPVIVTRDMVAAMKPGAVVVDLAVENGGNVEGVVRDEVVDMDGVKVLGQGNMAGRVAAHASLAFSNNVTSLVEAFWDSPTQTLVLPPEDEIIQGCLVTRDGRVCHPKLIESARKEGRN